MNKKYLLFNPKGKNKLKRRNVLFFDIKTCSIFKYYLLASINLLIFYQK